MELKKITLQNVRTFRGNEFPIAFGLDEGANSTLKDKVSFLKEKATAGLFRELLAKHGAVVLRNFGEFEPDGLAELINAIGSNSNAVFFEQNGSTAQRTEINNILSTANEGSPSRIIYQHNEFSRFTVYPSMLFFVCTENNSEGGETPIVHGGEYFEKLFEKDREEVNELAQRGLYFEQVWPLETNNKTSWSDKFCFGRHLNKDTEDLKEQKRTAEVLIKSKVSPEFEWDKDSNLIVHQRTYPIRLYKPSTGNDPYPVFFNSIATYYADVKYNISGNNKTKPLKYNDDGLIPEEFLERVLQTSIDLSYNHSWQKGDIVIIDNLQVSHGRNPWKNGERKVLVSMWDDPHRGDYEIWNA